MVYSTINQKHRHVYCDECELLLESDGNRFHTYSVLEKEQENFPATVHICEKCRDKVVEDLTEIGFTIKSIEKNAHADH